MQICKNLDLFVMRDILTAMKESRIAAAGASASASASSASAALPSSSTLVTTKGMSKGPEYYQVLSAQGDLYSTAFKAARQLSEEREWRALLIEYLARAKHIDQVRQPRVEWSGVGWRAETIKAHTMVAARLSMQQSESYPMLIAAYEYLLTTAAAR